MSAAVAGLVGREKTTEPRVQHEPLKFDRSVNRAKRGLMLTPLGSVIRLQYGKPLDRENRKINGRFPVFGANGEMDRSDRYYCHKPSIVIGRKGSAGELKLTEGKFWPLDVTYFVEFDDNRTDLKFLFYMLKTLNLTGLARGVKPGINRNDVYTLKGWFPELVEQQRIVAILDEVFAGIDKARANAEQNLRNARELFESHLQSVFARAEKDWPIVDLADLAGDITDGDHMPPPKSSEGVPFITISNINKQTHSVDFDDTFMVSDEYFRRLKPNKKPQKGDVLYTVTGSFGIPVRVEHDNPFCFQRHIGLVRPNSETTSAWLYYLLLSPQAFDQADVAATGTAQKTVSLKVLRSLKVPRVPLAEQHRLTRSLDALSAETRRLATIYQQKLTNLGELKHSLLARAFAGDL